MDTPTFKEPDNLLNMLTDFADVVQSELDSSNQTAPCWVLVDDGGNVQPWRLIVGKFGPVWQHKESSGVFVGAMLEPGERTKNGLIEVAKDLSVSLLFDKQSLEFKVKRVGK